MDFRYVGGHVPVLVPMDRPVVTVSVGSHDLISAGADSPHPILHDRWLERPKLAGRGLAALDKQRADAVIQWIMQAVPASGSTRMRSTHMSGQCRAMLRIALLMIFALGFQPGTRLVQDLA